LEHHAEFFEVYGEKVEAWQQRQSGADNGEVDNSEATPDSALESTTLDAERDGANNEDGNSNDPADADDDDDDDEVDANDDAAAADDGDDAADIDEQWVYFNVRIFDSLSDHFVI